MINLLEIENINLDSNKTIILKLFNSSMNIIDNITVSDKFIIDNNIDVISILSNNGYLASSLNEYNIQIEVIDYISKNVIYDVNRARDEFLLSSEELGNSGLEAIKDFNERTIFVSFNNNESYISDINIYDSNVVIATQDPIRSISTSSEVSIFEKLYTSEVEEFTFVFEEEVRPRVVLEGHTKKDLVNFDLESKSTSAVKSFSDLISDNSSIDVNDIMSFYDNINIDYSDFSNHTRFSSAHSKIINIENKISEIDDLKAKIANNDGKVVEDKLRNDVERIFNKFTPYEKYVFSQVYSKMTTSEFSDWLVEKKDEAELYDLQNDEFILFLFPPDIIESDENGYFTNFLLMMGEFFDQIWLYIDSLSNIKERSFHTEYQISSDFVTDVLRDMGIDKNISYTDKNISEYFGGENTFEKISSILSKRLLYDLIFLYKTKGTEKAVREIINIFGIPRGFLDIYKFSNSTEKSEETIQSVEYDWAMTKNADEDVSINIFYTDLGSDFTFEMMIKDFDSSGKLLSVDASNYISYSVTNNNMSISVYDGGVEVANSISIPIDPNNWSYICITNNNIYFWQQDRAGYGIVNNYTSTISLGNVFGGTFSNINIFEGTTGNITELRVYNSIISENEAKDHAMDFRSTSEENLSIISRIKFYKPDDTFTEILPMIGNFFVAMSGVDATNFFTDEFFNYNIVNYIFGEDFNVSDIRIDELNNEISSLGRDFRSEFKYGNEDDMNDVVGLFLSPSKKANIDIIRKYGDFLEYIPSEFDDNKTYFENLEIHEDKIDSKIYNDALYNTIFRVVNNRIFDIIKLFISVSSDFEYGFLIKNHIFKKNRSYILTKDGEGSVGYELLLGQDRKIERQISNDDHSINIMNITQKPTVYADKNGFDKNTTLKYYSGDSIFNGAIKNDTTTSFSEFYSKKIIKGTNPSSPSDEEITILENSGASIIVS